MSEESKGTTKPKKFLSLEELQRKKEEEEKALKEKRAAHNERIKREYRVGGKKR